MTAATKERPIIFHFRSVEGILSGRKTQTRRVVNRLNRFLRITEFGVSDTPGYDWEFRDRRALWNEITQDTLMQRCPYGVPGDRLWVREKWRCVAWPGDYGEFTEVIQFQDKSKRSVSAHREHTLEREAWSDRMAFDGVIDLEKAGFRFDGFGRMLNEHSFDFDNPPVRWRSPIHMPRWASRITLEIVDVWVERLQDISIRNVIAEGVSNKKQDDSESLTASNSGLPSLAHYRFACNWDRTNAKRGYSWESNPFVWVVEFRRIDA